MSTHNGLRAVLYLRQSTYREESISLELQEHEGRTYAQRNGYQIVAVEADPGISGRTWKRPAVQRVMDMIEAHEADVIVLWKWSRLSRSRLDWAVAADRVETAGGRIESATEPLDTTTSTGRFARGMLTEFAAFESERIGDVWRESHSRRIRNGLPANGKPRFGYIYSRGEGFTLHPIEAPVLGETFRRYIGGESVWSLTQWLNDGPTRPVSGYGVKSDGMWSDRTIRRVLDSGFAAGLISSHGELIPGAHEPIITGDEWDAYREARQRRRTYRRTERSEYVFSGLVWCSCGSKMHAGLFGAQRVAKYRCKDAHEKRRHAGGYVSETVIMDAVMGQLHEWADELNAGIKSNMGVPRKPRTSSTLHIDKQLAVNAGKMETLAEKLVSPGIPHDTYIRLRDKFEQERVALEAERVSATVTESFTPAQVIPDLLANWDLMTIPERREILRALIARIEVTPGHPKATVEITPK